MPDFTTHSVPFSIHFHCIQYPRAFVEFTGVGWGLWRCFPLSQSIGREHKRSLARALSFNFHPRYRKQESESITMKMTDQEEEI